MDSGRFYRIVRTIGQTRTRRQTVRGLAGAAAGTLGLGGQEARAGKTCAADGSWCRLVERKRTVRAQDDICKREGKPCKKNSQCCSDNCTPPGGRGSVAGSASICCPAGQDQDQDGHCVSTTCAPEGAPVCDCSDLSTLFNCCSLGCLCGPGTCL